MQARVLIVPDTPAMPNPEDIESLEIGDNLTPEAMLKLRRAWITHMLAGRFGAAEFLKNYLPSLPEQPYDRNSAAASGRGGVRSYAIAGEVS